MSSDTPDPGDRDRDPSRDEEDAGTSDETDSARPTSTGAETPEAAGGKGPPTPVRAMMGEPKTESPGPPSPAETTSRELEVEGRVWSAHALGRTRTGTAPDPGAPLLLVGFRRVDEAEDEEADEGAPDYEREALAVSESLEELSDLDLESLFERSRPFQRLPGPEERRERRASPVRKDLGRGRGR